MFFKFAHELGYVFYGQIWNTALLIAAKYISGILKTVLNAAKTGRATELLSYLKIKIQAQMPASAASEEQLRDLQNTIL